MGKKAALKRTNSAQSDPAMDYFAGFDARQQLLGSIVGMGWRLALTVILPIFIGVQLDKKFDSSPSITLAAFFIAIFMSGMLIARTYKDISAETAKYEANHRTKRRKSRTIVNKEEEQDDV